jgi:hypothetical protein
LTKDLLMLLLLLASILSLFCYFLAGISFRSDIIADPPAFRKKNSFESKS